MLSMRFRAFRRCWLDLPIMSTSNTCSSFYIVFGSIVCTPSTFNHFLKILLHVLKFGLNFNCIFFGITSLSFLLVSNFLQRPKWFSYWIWGSLWLLDWDWFTFPHFNGSSCSCLNLNYFISCSFGKWVYNIEIT